MRTVLDDNTLAFEEGFRAQEAGTDRNKNPYDSRNQPDLRSAWFSGWDYAKTCGGSCDR